MSTVVTPITAAHTVNDVVRQHPATLSVLNEFGIDSCCGGGLPLRIAVEREGADLEILLARLNAAAKNS